MKNANKSPKIRCTVMVKKSDPHFVPGPNHQQKINNQFSSKYMTPTECRSVPSTVKKVTDTITTEPKKGAES